jgi:MFS family permease
VQTAPERIRPPIEPTAAHSSDGLDPRAPLAVELGLDRRAARTFARLAELRRPRPVLIAYLGTRVLLIAVALVDGALRGHGLHGELAHWDGLWYLRLASDGYPTYVPHAANVRTTLGFFPLYPITIWLVSYALSVSADTAGLVVAAIGGLVATLLVERLASGWWGQASGRRAAILFCLFPGSVVFSMDYSEGLLIALAAGCILALEHRRWLLAGILAGFATAAQPVALALVPVCAVSAMLEFRRRGWSHQSARRSLLAPLLSLTGVCAFAGFLWVWTGTPFATLQAQRYGWDERTNPLALVHQARTLASEISFTHFDHPTINLNLVIGSLGVVVMLIGLWLLLGRPRLVSIEAIVWTFGIAFLASTSQYMPPNPRVLITAFPVVVVFAQYIRGRGYAALAIAGGGLLVVLSALTFVGTTLRP